MERHELRGGQTFASLRRLCSTKRWTALPKTRELITCHPVGTLVFHVFDLPSMEERSRARIGGELNGRLDTGLDGRAFFPDRERKESGHGTVRITSAGQVVLAMYLGNTRAPKSGLISSKQLDPPRMVSGSTGAGLAG
ncbi:hypothetical protein K0M31_019100 [Melipona bicolor]|uniref:Uncharacterized protein n=1 Tax=Melipona bicolor TaxID=60889 RepID=A0AA40G1I3_9HYME|nr:hypothetical protein K0M31_019100 [Melipona bicolor]